MFPSNYQDLKSSHASGSGTRLSASQKVFLILVVPVLILTLGEALCRGVNLPAYLNSLHHPLALEMPTWMQNDENQLMQSARASINPAALLWLGLFQEGSGFRVRMKPGIASTLTNTFSQIPSIEENHYFLRSNALGFRSQDLQPQKATVAYRVLIFGDSSSFGWGVDQDQMYDKVLAAKLSQLYGGKTFEVGNFAIPGDSSEYGRLLFDKYAHAYNPDLVILGFGANDAKKVYRSHTKQVEKFRSNSKLVAIKNLLKKSSLFSSLDSLISYVIHAAQPQAVPGYLHPAVGRKRYRDNLNYMAQASRRAGSGQVLLLTLCTPSNYAAVAKNLAKNHDYLFLNGQKHLVDHISGLKSGSLYPQMVARMRKLYPQALETNDLFYVTSDSCHPNRVGHTLIGEAIAEMIHSARLI